MEFDLFDVITELDLPPAKCVVQVGASYGQEMKRFLECGISHGIFIEPLGEPYSYLVELCKNIPDFLIVNSLCTDVPDNKYTFHVASNGGQSSSIHKPTGHLDVFDFVKFENKI